MTKEPFIAHSEMTNEIYIVCGTEKYPVTEQVIKAMQNTGRLERQSSEDCVSRAELKKWLDMNFSFGGALRKLEMFDRIDNELPSVTPTRKVGEWVIDDNEYGRIWRCHCSICKKDPLDYIGGTENWWLDCLPDYCPTCGSYNQNIIENER